MPGTTCKEAIKNWEAEKGEDPAESKVVKLYCQVPPIVKMDDSLNGLSKCEHLSLSTNQIERMMGLGKLTNLRILSLARNQIKRIMGLEELGSSLEELWMSYNVVEKLDGLQNCSKLHTFYISNNKIKSFDEVAKLAPLPELKAILLQGNPVYGDNEVTDMVPHVVKRIPSIGNVDGELIDD